MANDYRIMLNSLSDSLGKLAASYGKRSAASDAPITQVATVTGRKYRTPAVLMQRLHSAATHFK